MQWILIIGSEKLTLDSVKAIDHYGSISTYDVPEIKNRYCVDFGEDHILYDYEEGEVAIRDFEESDLKCFPFADIHVITMVYTTEQRMRKVLQQENYLNDVYVDNDHGLIVPIGEFIKLGMPVEPK